MKKKLIIIALMFGIGFSSCTEYLNVSENSGLTEEEIYSSYTYMQALFNTVYMGDKTSLDTNVYNVDIVSSFPIENSSSTRGFTMDQTVDTYTSGSASGGAAQFIKGSFATTVYAYFNVYYNDASTNNFKPGFMGAWNVVRTCNTIIQHADEIKDANSESDILDMKAEAYFLRAFAHFVVGKKWGPFPYITEILSADNWDRERLSGVDYYQQIANDCDTAKLLFEEAGFMRRGVVGSLTDSKQNHPCGVSALALKSRALLYRASPLSNPDGNKEYWLDAAEAAAEAITVAESYGYVLATWDDYTNIFNTATHHDEHLWGLSKLNGTIARGVAGWFMTNNLGGTLTQAGSSSTIKGCFPTQSNVDMYDTAWGMPLETEAERAAAIAAGQYNEQDPYANRDPRLAVNVYYNQTDMIWTSTYCQAGEETNKYNCYYTTNSDGTRSYSTFAVGFTGLNGASPTGYAPRKRTKNYNKGYTTLPAIAEVIFRLGEMYLNYAEAANEYGGPDYKTSNAPSGLDALGAMNVIRGRVSQDMVIDASDTRVATQDKFRLCIQKERTVELDQEDNHRYFDIRRWCIASDVMTQTKQGMLIEQISTDTSLPYEQRFKHTRVDLSSTFQGVWRDYMNFWPLATDDYYLYQNFDTSLNPYW